MELRVLSCKVGFRESISDSDRLRLALETPIAVQITAISREMGRVACPRQNFPELLTSGSTRNVRMERGTRWRRTNQFELINQSIDCPLTRRPFDQDVVGRLNFETEKSSV